MPNISLGSCSNVNIKVTIVLEHIKEVENRIDLWVGEDSSLQRRDLLAQYLAYHQPDWVVYIADVQTDRSTDKCTLQLATLLEVTGDRKTRLAVLASSQFVKHVMKIVPSGGGKRVEYTSTVDDLLNVLSCGLN